MNVTPNSFSDGGKLSNEAVATEKFRQALAQFDIVDVGAESTAPFNDPIGASEEISRLEEFFYPLFEALEDPQTTISLDTYRPEIFYEVSLWLKKCWPKTQLIFNDVSGQVDGDLLSLLKEDLEFSYVFSHNLCLARDEAGSHMKTVSAAQGMEHLGEMADFFKSALAKLEGRGKEILVDPCFGFSKTRQQNHFLLANFKAFADMLPVGNKILIGLSRKSFLRIPRELDPKQPQAQAKLDSLQGLLAFDLIRALPKRDLVFRTHSPTAFMAINDAFQITRP